MTADLPFSRPVPLRMDMPALAVKVAADASARAAVAAFLDLPAVERLEVLGTLERQGRGFTFDGRVVGSVTQSCVVTFEEVAALIDVPVRRHLVVGAPAPTAEAEVDPLAEDVEHLAAPTFDVGAMAVEELSLALDPYPRSAGADAVLAAIAQPDPAPLAALARRRGGA